jgi:hypothetical protein
VEIDRRLEMLDVAEVMGHVLDLLDLAVSPSAHQSAVCRPEVPPLLELPASCRIDVPPETPQGLIDCPCLATLSSWHLSAANSSRWPSITATEEVVADTTI